MNVQNSVVKYLDEATMMQIVTMAGDRPWIATVFFAADNRHNIYWLSPASTRHSHEIARNNRVVGAITVPHQYGQPQQGLQFEGIAREVSTDEIAANFQAYAERFDAYHRLQNILSGLDDNRLYEIVPTDFVLWDEANFPTQPRQEWRISAGNEAVTPAPSPGADPSSGPAPFNPLET
jgi:uncharacterized protein YhbP (UPF0306 family)